MQLSALEARSSFALLGPGFGEGDWILVSPLEASDSPDVWIAHYEDAVPQGFSGDVQRFAELDLDVTPARVEPHLEAPGYASAVATIREAIARGDVYEVNLTVRARFTGKAAAIFARLATQRPRFFPRGHLSRPTPKCGAGTVFAGVTDVRRLSSTLRRARRVCRRKCQ